MTIRFTTVKVGLVTAIALLASVMIQQSPAAALQPCSTNDDIACATTLAAGLPVSDIGTNVGATQESGEPQSSCSNGIGDTVWWQWSPSVSTNVVAQTLGSDFDTVLSVWEGATGPASAVGCNDQVFDTNQSQVGFFATAGKTYWIQIESYDNVPGSIQLELWERFAPCHDSFSCAVELGPALPDSWAQWNDLATAEPDEQLPSCASGTSGGTLWYSFTPTVSADVWFGAFGNNGQAAVVAVWTGTNLGSLAERGCSAGSARVELSVQAGTTYFIQVSDAEGIADRFTVWVQEVCGQFDDVDNADYFYSPVEWAACVGITTGTSATTFSPDDTVTRAQLATLLWRYAGEPVGWTHQFSDVSAGAYYDAPVAWMSGTGITSGTSPTTFSPFAPVTRAQLATFLWRYVGEPLGWTHQFSDVSAGAYYDIPVGWMSGTGITSGTSPTTFSPLSTLTRGQAVTFLYRLTFNSSIVPTDAAYMSPELAEMIADLGATDPTVRSAS